MKSLNTLLQYKANTIYPGHGALVKNGQEKIAEYISHRNKREKQVFIIFNQKIYKAMPNIAYTLPLYIFFVFILTCFKSQMIIDISKVDM